MYILLYQDIKETDTKSSTLSVNIVSFITTQSPTHQCNDSHAKKWGFGIVKNIIFVF